MGPRQLRRVVAANIRRELERREMGPNALADFAGVSRSHLFDFLAGRKGISLDLLARIAVALECEPSSLLVPAPVGRTTAR